MPTIANIYIAINPKDDDGYDARGKAYASNGQYDLSIIDFSKAIAINLQDVDGYNSRSNAYANKGQYDLAITDCNKAIAPSNPRILMHMVTVV